MKIYDFIIKGVMNCYKKTGKNWTFCVYYKGLN